MLGLEVELFADIMLTCSRSYFEKLHLRDFEHCRLLVDGNFTKAIHTQSTMALTAVSHSTLPANCDYAGTGK